jgi:hypothetical protein
VESEPFRDFIILKPGKNGFDAGEDDSTGLAMTRVWSDPPPSSFELKILCECMIFLWICFVFA